MSEHIQESEVHGEWMGMLKVSASACDRLRQTVQEIVESADQSGRVSNMPALINMLIERGEKIRVIYTRGQSLDVDTLDDVVTSSSFG